MYHAVSNHGHSKGMLAAVCQQMHDASIVTESEDVIEGITLSSVPWKLRCIGEIARNHISDNASASPYGPPWNYIDIRRTQNMQWAKNQLTEGIILAKAGRDKEAEEYYKKGLDLVPEYVELLVAYGALCANQGRLEEGIAKLEKATKIDAQSPNAQSYLDAIRRRQSEAKSKATPTTRSRSDKLVQDVMAEHAFLTGATTSIKLNHNGCGSYPLVYEEINEESDCDTALDCEKRKHRKVKERVSKKKSRKRNRNDDNDSGDNISEGSSARWERKRLKKRRRKRRREQSSSEIEEATSRRHHHRNISTSQGSPESPKFREMGEDQSTHMGNKAM